MQMTKQEAIERLHNLQSLEEDNITACIGVWYKGIKDDYDEALDMAIEALQQGCENVAEGCDDYITIKRQFVLDAINIGLSGYISDDDKLTLEGMGITVSEMPTTDLSGYSDRLWKSAYDRGYERCRQDAIDAFEPDHRRDWYTPEIIETLEDLPSAKPERKNGEWIEEPNCMYRCSCCKAHYPSIRGYMDYKFCPNCGARMTGGE